MARNRAWARRAGACCDVRRRGRERGVRLSAAEAGCVGTGATRFFPPAGARRPLLRRGAKPYARARWAASIDLEDRLFRAKRFAG